MYINVEDHVAYSRPNPEFASFARLLHHPSCRARMHWCARVRAHARAMPSVCCCARQRALPMTVTHSNPRPPQGQGRLGDARQVL